MTILQELVTNFMKKEKQKPGTLGGSLALKQIVWILRQLPSRMGAEVFIS